MTGILGAASQKGIPAKKYFPSFWQCFEMNSVEINFEMNFLPNEAFQALELKALETSELEALFKSAPKPRVTNELLK